MVSGWQCVKLGSAAVAGIVPVAPWMIAAYLAAHKLPADCAAACRFVIPAAEFRRGGMFGPEAARAGTPDAAAMSDGFTFAGDWAPDGLPATYIAPDEAGLPAGGGGAAEGGGPRSGPGGGGPSPGFTGLPGGTGGGGTTLPRGPDRPGPQSGTDGEPPTDSPRGNGLPVTVPAPAAWSLLLAALLGLAAVRRRISPCSHRGG